MYVSGHIIRCITISWPQFRWLVAYLCEVSVRRSAIRFFIAVHVALSTVCMWNKNRTYQPKQLEGYDLRSSISYTTPVGLHSQHIRFRKCDQKYQMSFSHSERCSDPIFKSPPQKFFIFRKSLLSKIIFTTGAILCWTYLNHSIIQDPLKHLLRTKKQVSTFPRFKVLLRFFIPELSYSTWRCIRGYIL